MVTMAAINKIDLYLLPNEIRFNFPLLQILFEYLYTKV